jgi:cell division initiation protein
LALQNAQRTFLDKLQEISPEPPAQPDEVDKTVSEIDDNVQRLLQQAMVDATAENLQSDGQTQEQEPEPEQDLSDTAEFAPVSTAAASHGQEETSADPVSQQGSRIDFGDLQFGRDYEIT